MLRPIKITHPDDQIFLISDTHFSHNRPFIIEPRGFKTMEEHDETLIARWNETCDDNSIIFHLGDFIFNSDEAGFWTMVRRLNFKHLWIQFGNHLSGHRQAYQAALRFQFPEMVFETDPSVFYEIYPLHVNVDGNPKRRVSFLPQYVEVSVGKTQLVLCHYAVESWNGMAHGTYMIFGHSHGALKNVMSFRLDVGIENFGRPISLAKIKELTKDQKPDVVDHHV